MTMLTRTFAAALFATAGFAAQAETVTLDVQWPYGNFFKDTFDQIKEQFEAENPDIKINYRTPYEEYEQATQMVLREAITDSMPDVSFQGLNRLRILVDREIAQSLDPFIEAEADFDKDGYHKAMMDLTTINDGTYGIPFAVSLPLVYYNMDLVEAAGGSADDLPETWDEVIDLAKKINALEGDAHGMWFGWSVTGNWMWQALVFSQEGTMLDPEEREVAFGGPEGEWAIDQIARFVNETDMPNLAYKESPQVFSAGRVGMFVWSSSQLVNIGNTVGDKFTMKTGPFPNMKEAGGLPSGGNTVVMLAKDPERQAAAWKFIKFATSGRGAAVVARTTGYLPPNTEANRVYLADFYETSPNHLPAVNQLPKMTGWYAFPGKNGLKITQVIYDNLESIVTRQRNEEPQAVLGDMVTEVQGLLPRD